MPFFLLRLDLWVTFSYFCGVEMGKSVPRKFKVQFSVWWHLIVSSNKNVSQTCSPEKQLSPFLKLTGSLLAGWNSLYGFTINNVKLLTFKGVKSTDINVLDVYDLFCKALSLKTTRIVNWTIHTTFIFQPSCHFKLWNKVSLNNIFFNNTKSFQIPKYTMYMVCLVFLSMKTQLWIGAKTAF